MTIAGYARLDQVNDMSTAVVEEYPYDYVAATYPRGGWAKPPNPSSLLRIDTVPVVDVPSTDNPRDHTITPILPPSWDVRAGQWQQLYDSVPSSERLTQAKIDGKNRVYRSQASKVSAVTQGSGQFEPATEDVKRNELLSRDGGGPDLNDFPVLQGEQIGRGWSVTEAVDNIQARMDAIDVKLALYDKEKFIAEGAIDAASSADEIAVLVDAYAAIV